MAVLLLLAACGSGNAVEDNRREVEKQQRGHDFVPTGAIDDALRTEAVANVGRIKNQMQVAKMRNFGDDMGRMARELSGTLDAAKLAKINMTEADLQGQHYVASDYSLSFNGSAVTVTTTAKGTRGHISETFELR